MLKITLKLLLGSVLLVASQACAPGQPTADLNAINTAIAQTLAAITQTSEPGIPVTGDESPTPSATTVAATPTVTALVLPTLEMTSTPAVIPAGAQITVSVPTNCRVGPGVVYDRVGGLQVGEVAEVVGRNTAGNYWVIRNPNRPGETCWLWGEYATLTGYTGILPVLTPPPTPTPSPTAPPSPDFTAAYNNFESCAGTGWWVDFELENHGSIVFNSMAMTVRDTVTNVVVSLYSNDFTNRDGCNQSATRDNLPASQELLVSSPVFSSDPRGHGLRATITLCSNTNQSGTCVTESIEFTP